MKHQTRADKRDDKDAVTETDAHNKATRLGRCEVCAAHEARYACPKCEVKTCCVGCVQIHKKELECDGIRDRTKFIPLRQMTTMDFMSDYYLLEEATRYVQQRKDDKLKCYTRYNQTLPPHLYRLRQAALERQTKLRFLLQHFTRHKENSTYYCWKLKKIYWRIEWIFVNANALQYVDKRCAEDVPLAQLLDKYVNPASIEEVPQKKSLEYYQSAGVYQLQVLLKAEGIKRCRTRFYQLDVSKTLRENLAGKTLVEHPCVYLSYESGATGAFDIIDSDEDVEAEAKSYQTALDEQHKAKLAEKQLATSYDETGDAKRVAMSKTERRAMRKRKREEFDKAVQTNFLFADEAQWDLLSSSSEDEDATSGAINEQLH